METDEFTVSATLVKHKNMKCYGYVFQEKDLQGRFPSIFSYIAGTIDAEALSKYVKPSALYKKIKSGEITKITTDAGELDVSKFVGPPTPGRKVGKWLRKAELRSSYLRRYFRPFHYCKGCYELRFVGS